jgi:hypothetical protein
MEDERISEMKERVSKISSFIPISFYFRVLIGILIILQIIIRLFINIYYILR